MMWLVATAQAGVWCSQKGGVTALDYKTAVEAAAEETKRAAAEMRSPAPSAGNGLLVFTVKRQTIELAHPENQLVVVESGGKELIRVAPDRSNSAGPEVPAHPTWIGCQYSCWWSIVTVAVPETALPLSVHLADKVMASRCDWTVDENGRVR